MGIEQRPFEEPPGSGPQAADLPPAPPSALASAWTTGTDDASGELPPPPPAGNRDEREMGAVPQAGIDPSVPPEPPEGGGLLPRRIRDVDAATGQVPEPSTAATRPVDVSPDAAAALAIDDSAAFAAGLRHITGENPITVAEPTVPVSITFDDRDVGHQPVRPAPEPAAAPPAPARPPRRAPAPPAAHPVPEHARRRPPVTAEMPAARPATPVRPSVVPEPAVARSATPVRPSVVPEPAVARSATPVRPSTVPEPAVAASAPAERPRLELPVEPAVARAAEPRRTRLFPPAAAALVAKAAERSPAPGADAVDEVDLSTLPPPPIAARAATTAATAIDVLEPIVVAAPVLAAFAHLDASEEPSLPGVLVGPARLAESTRTAETIPVRPSVTAAPLRVPAEPIPLTPLFGGARETVTDSTTPLGFEAGAEPAEAHRLTTPWRGSPLLDLTHRGSDDDHSRALTRTRLIAIGLAATVLPTIGLVAATRGGSQEPIAAAGTDMTPPEVVAVTYTVGRPTAVPPDEASSQTATTTLSVSSPTDPTITSGPPPTDAPTTTTPSFSSPSTAGALPPPPPPPPLPPPNELAPPTTRAVTTTTVAATPPGTAAQPPPAPASSFLLSVSEADREFLVCIRGGRAWNAPGGGAYQLTQQNWDATAARVAPELVGVRPETATPDQQTIVALGFKGDPTPKPWDLRCR